MRTSAVSRNATRNLSRVVRNTVEYGLNEHLRALFVITFVAGAFGCSSAPTDVSKADGAFSALKFDTAAQYAAITVDGVKLSANASIDVEFTEPGQVFGYIADLEEGQSVTLETFGTWGLDTVLYLYGPDNGEGYFGELPVAMDDDSGEGMFSYIAPYTVKKGGTYIAIISTFDGNGKGHATLLMQSGDGEPGEPSEPDDPWLEPGDDCWPDEPCEPQDCWEDENCGDAGEVVSPDPTMNGCPATLDCALNCDPECLFMCLDGADEWTHVMMGELVACAENTDCGNDIGCLEMHCPDQIMMCLEGDPGLPPDAGQCEETEDGEIICPDPDMPPEDPSTGECEETPDGEIICPDPDMPGDQPQPEASCADAMICTFELCDGPPEACVEPCLEQAPPEVHELFWALLECEAAAQCDWQGDCLAEHCGELTQECLGPPEVL